MSRSLIGACSLVIALSACTTFQSSERTPASAATYVDPNYITLQKLIAESIDFRAKALQFAQEKNIAEGKDIKMSRQESDWVRATGIKYLETRQQLMEIALEEANLFLPGNEVKLAPGQGTQTIVRTEQVERGRTVGVKKTTVTYIDPLDGKGQELLFKVQMSLASSLILMDNYIVGVAPYYGNNAIRYQLNYDTMDESKKRVLQSIADSYSNPVQRVQMSKAIEFIDSLMDWRRKQSKQTSSEESYLYGVTQSSIWYLTVRNGDAGTGLADRVTNLWNRLMLRGTRGVRGVSYGISMGFGNMVGMYEERKGLLYTMPDSEQKGIIGELKPLDILMEKTPFRLTDKFIPGHYGHVAIWLGTEDQLKDLRVWDQLPPVIQARVRSGHHIVEALRPGVEVNSLQHFLNIDDFLVLRDNRNVTDDYRRHAIKLAVEQVGKEYDFNFDVNTHNRIVCSEIAYVVFDDVKWPTAETLARYTISPDNVAQLAVGDAPILDPVILYYNGKRYNKDLRHSLDLLLKATDQSYAEFERFQKN